MKQRIMKMKKEWEDFFIKNKAKGNPEYFFSKIANQYSYPKRHYHTFEEHIFRCIEEFNSIRGLCENPDAVYYGILNHDAFSDTKRKDNEEKSAEFAYCLGREIGLPDRFLIKCAQIIMSTSHRAPPADIDEMLAADIDLSILGQNPKIFNEYEKEIRKEYDWVPEEEFKRKRAAILKKFLERETIYHTDVFRDKYEKQARKNLEISINNLLI